MTTNRSAGDDAAARDAIQALHPRDRSYAATPAGTTAAGTRRWRTHWPMTDAATLGYSRSAQWTVPRRWPSGSVTIA
jgi:hypothetical protein